MVRLIIQKRIAAVLIFTGLCGGALRANTIFGLAGDPNHNYTFTRTDTPVSGSEYPNWQVQVPSGPYPGWLVANIPADQGAFFCIDFLKTATFGASYPGTLVLPSTPQEIEAAYLASIEYGYGAANANINLYAGPLSMAIWQIMDPTPGDVPRDPAAQSWVTQAQNLYAAGQLQASMFANTTIFVPNDPSIQRFMLAAAETPEPETMVLLGTGVLLIVAGFRRAKR